jgi:hypothetical protein|tara:strand:- start:184 stop:336 length:153 start_codon:yes stop_codon:yes gene_type:complete
MAKKVIKKVTSKKSKPVEKKPVDKKEVVEVTLKDTVQYIKVYPKYNPLRK